MHATDISPGYMQRPLQSSRVRARDPYRQFTRNTTYSDMAEAKKGKGEKVSEDGTRRTRRTRPRARDLAS